MSSSHRKGGRKVKKNGGRKGDTQDRVEVNSCSVLIGGLAIIPKDRRGAEGTP